MSRLIVVLALTGLASSGCSDLLVDERSGTGNVSEFEAAWSVVNNVYPYFAFKQINWDSIHAVYTPLAEKARGDEIVEVLFNLLAELKDGHVNLKMQRGGVISTYQPLRSEKDRQTFDPSVVRKYFDKELKLSADNTLEYEMIPGNVGYIRLTTFKNGTRLDEIYSALEYLRNTKALIIDVRHNGGGSTNISDVVVSRFLGAPLNYPPVYIKNQLQPSATLQPGGPFQYDHSVVVLANGVCFSTTEHFVEMMKQLATVTVIGDTTGGGSGAPEYFRLPSGRRINVPTKDFRRYDGVPYEWNGVPPDILVLQTEEDVKQGRDKQLEYAIQLLR